MSRDLGRVDYEGVPPEELPAVVVLAAGGTQEEAGQAVGKGRKWIMDRARTPSWVRAIADLRDSAVSRATALLTEAAADAVAQLHLMIDEADSHGNRIRASIAVLDFVLKYRDHADYGDRLRALEEKATAFLSGQLPVARPEGPAVGQSSDT